MSLNHSLAKRTSYEAPHYAVSSNLLSFPTVSPGPTINNINNFGGEVLGMLNVEIDFKGMG
jgi:hypothetical protein